MGVQRPLAIGPLTDVTSEDIAFLVNQSRETLERTERRNSRLVQKKIDALDLPRPKTEAELWADEHTIRRTVGEFAEVELKPIIEDSVERAVVQGYQTADELLRMSLDASGIPHDLLTNVNNLADRIGQDALRDPLANLIRSMPEHAVQFFRQAILAGVDVNLDDLFLSFARADRTATFTAYRDAKLQRYRDNRNVVKGWIWHSALGTRTCPVCFEKHGSFHELDEGFSSHQNCRCSPIPKTKSYRELGFDVPDHLESSIEIEDGASIFARLDTGDKVKILGPSAYAAYERGEITLADFTTYKMGSDGKIRPQRASNKSLGIERQKKDDNT